MQKIIMDSKLILAIILATAVCAIYPTLVSSHGRLLEPPNRSSLWRFEEFEEFNVTVNYEDNQLFCGGVEVQHGLNGGKCGECGDPYDQARPRDNENGGLYGRGIIVRNYTVGQLIDVFVELTAVHLGHFEFRLCPLNELHTQEEEKCFRNNVLKFSDGKVEYWVVDEEVIEYPMQIKLPEGYTCDHCVLQWHYQTGNSWGVCPNGTEMVGCGPQETFRGCADISILN